MTRSATAVGTLALMTAMGHLPLAVARALGRTFGLVARIIGGRPAQNTRINLALCLPEHAHDARRRLLRESLEETGMLLAETARAWVAAPEDLLSAMRIGADRALLDAALHDDRGLLVLVPHLGNWEMLNLWLQAHVGPSKSFTALYEPVREPALDAWIRERRERTGARLLPADASGVRGLVRALARGDVVGLLPDQVPPRPGGVIAPFLGLPARTMTLAAGLLRTTGARALVGTALRVPDGFTVRFLPVASTLADPDPIRAATALNAAVAAAVALAPAQYQWEYKRFKHAPTGHWDPYKRTFESK